MFPSAPFKLSHRDWLILASLCVVLNASLILTSNSFSGHQAVQPQSAREMMVHHDWLVPTYGGLPWLERPPLPHWLMVAAGYIFGGLEQDWVPQLVAALVSMAVVFSVAWLGAFWYGRVIGLMSGAILATTFVFTRYCTNPEADIFLCGIVTLTIVIFVRLEFGSSSDEGQGFSFIGRRSWLVLAFFVLLGMTNLAKGLLFGTMMAAIPAGAFLLLQGNLKAARRYIWLWGWLAFAAVWLAWPVAVYQRYPDVIELWFSDYFGRLNGEYKAIGEPWWYYLAAVPYVLLPWTIVCLAGLVSTGRKACREAASPERFLWIWAVFPPAIFSLADGKHHHYLLQCLAPWAILGAIGSYRVWKSIPSWPSWLRQPLGPALIYALLADGAVWHFRDVLKLPQAALIAALVVCPLLCLFVCVAVLQRNGRLAFGLLLSVLTLSFCSIYWVRDKYFNEYNAENAFLRRIREVVPSDKYYICSDIHVLETFRLLYYSDERARLLHNLTYLSDARIKDRIVYVLGREKDAAELGRYGQVEIVLRSESTRGEEKYPGYHRVVYRLQLDEDRKRTDADIPMSTMQAVHRAPGPFLY